MSLNTEKEYIKAEIDKVEDAYLVEATKNLIAYSKVSKYEQRLHPMTKEEFLWRNKESRKDIKKKNLISQEDVKKYFTTKNVR